jgi:hypothetical protein
MTSKEFEQFSHALRLDCSSGLLEAYERKKVMFPHGGIVEPRQLYSSMNAGSEIKE